MKQRLRSFFEPPVLGSVEETRRGRVLHSILIVLLTFTSAFAVVFLFLNSEDWRGRTLVLIGLLVEILVYLLLKRGQIQAAGMALIYLLWGILAAAVFLWDGITGVSIMGQLLLIFMSGLLISERFAVVLTILTIATNYGIMLIEHSSGLPFGISTLQLPAKWLLQSIYFLMTLGLMRIFVRNMQATLNEALWNERVLKDRVTELRQAQAQLEMSDQNLRRREAILESVRIAAEKLFRGRSFSDAVVSVLKDLGLATGVDRVYIFENHIDEHSELVTSQRYEWVAEGIEPQIDNPDLQYLPFQSSGFGRWPQILASNETIRAHVKDLPNSERELLQEQHILSVLIVPIFLGEAWWGFIGFDETKWEREWSPAEEDALRGAAGIIGGAIEQRRAERALNQSEARYLAILQDQSDMICRYTPDGMLTFANQAYMRYFDIPLERVKDLNIWDQIAPEDLPRVRNKIASLRPTLPPAVSQNRNQRSDGQLRWIEWTDRAIFDEHGEVVEVQAVGRDVDEEMRLKVQLDEYLRKMETQAMTDPLTGLLNRRAIMDHAAAEWQRAEREKRPLSMVVMDVDRLKQINDTHGHLVGDMALNKLADLMRQSMRRYDWVGRWGGDEFLLVLPGTDVEEAINVAERLRLKFKQSKLAVNDDQNVPLNMSLGVAGQLVISGEDSLENLLARADQALYQAKESGRDRVGLAD
jgi:diguanylate cyclase (GGDEF)-like protein/PAS domain S-box-containing protein